MPLRGERSVNNKRIHIQQYKNNAFKCQRLMVNETLQIHSNKNSTLECHKL